MPEYGGAEHDGTRYDGTRYDGTGYEAEHDGVDALLAALMDEPLPEGARQDAAFMAEHRSAVADVALLRDQLRLIGDTLAGEGPAPGPRAPGTVPAPGAALRPPRASAPLRPPKPAGPRRPGGPGRYRRFAGAAVGALVVAAGTALLGGLVWLGAHGGADSTSGADTGAGGDAASSKREDAPAPALPGEAHLACSKILAEGTVRSIEPAAAGSVRVVLEVKRHYRPEQSATDHPTVTVTLPKSAREDLEPGTYTLVRVPVYAQDRTDWETGPGIADARRDILAALPGARGTTCPGPDGGRG